MWGIFTLTSFLTSGSKLCIPFENSLSEELIDVFHKILDCVSNTAADEMRAAYKVGFKDGITVMIEAME